MKLGEILLKNKIISSTELMLVLKQKNTSNKKLGEILIDYKLVSSEQLTKALQEQYWRKKRILDNWLKFFG
jgi:hypothetical protein